MRILAEYYTKQRRSLMHDAARRIDNHHDAGDVVHDALVKAMERYDVTSKPGSLVRFLIAKAAIDYRLARRRLEVGLDANLIEAADLSGAIECRRMAEQACMALTQEEINALLMENERKPSRAFANRIRVARRKAAMAIGVMR